MFNSQLLRSGLKRTIPKEREVFSVGLPKNMTLKTNFSETFCLVVSPFWIKEQLAVLLTHTSHCVRSNWDPRLF